MQTLDELMKKAVEAYKALSPEQQAEMMEEQRQSFAKGNVALSQTHSPKRFEQIRDSLDHKDLLTSPLPHQWPYQQTFNAIAAATRIEGGNIAVSVDKFAEAFGPTPVVPVSPDATGKCGELETVGYQCSSDGLEWCETLIPNAREQHGYKIRDVVTRSQAVELLAAERAYKEIWKETAEKLERYNAALSARVKELETEVEKANDLRAHEWQMRRMAQCDADLWRFSVDMGDHPSLLVKVWKQRKALEAKLAAAEKALTEADEALQADAIASAHAAIRAVLGRNPS